MLIQDQEDHQHHSEHQRIAGLGEQCGRIHGVKPPRSRTFHKAGIVLQVNLVGYGARQAVDVFHAARQPVLILDDCDDDLRDAKRRNRQIIGPKTQCCLADHPRRTRRNHAANGPRHEGQPAVVLIAFTAPVQTTQIAG